MCSDGQLSCLLIGPLLLEFCNAHTAVVKDILCGSTLVTYSLFEVVSNPVSKSPTHFITNCHRMIIKEPDAALPLDNDQLTCQHGNMNLLMIHVRSR